LSAGEALATDGPTIVAENENVSRDAAVGGRIVGALDAAFPF
jgi:hypothetical protein